MNLRNLRVKHQTIILTKKSDKSCHHHTMPDKSLVSLCNQCIPRLTTIQIGFEDECGWQDVFGQPYLTVPRGVWKRHTKREKQRAKDQMVSAMLKELPDTNEARATADRMASCFMRFTTVPSDYTLGAMKLAMAQFLANSCLLYTSPSPRD